MAEQLRRASSRHTLAPGSWIDEQALAAEYGISRTPLREALKVLAAEGLVTMKLRRGAYVTEVSERDLAEVFHLLALLESDAARVVAGQRHARSRSPSCRRCTSSSKPRSTTATASLPPTSASTCACWRWPTTAGAIQLVADLRKVMKLNRHHSLFKQGRLRPR